MFNRIGSKLRALLPAVHLFDGDALGDALVSILTARLIPIGNGILVELRRAVLDATRAEPPAAYADELRALAPNLTNEHVAKFWSATYRAICAERSQPRPYLALVQPPAAEEEAASS